MYRKKQIKQLVDALAERESDTLFNPWRDTDNQDIFDDAPEQRKQRYLAHLLNPKVRVILVGEAAGYQGCRFTGIPFTSERLLVTGQIPGFAPSDRLTCRPRPWSEPSATIVWKALHDYGLAESALLWNAVPWHPHGDEPHSNRTPTKSERRAGLGLLASLMLAFPAIPVVAVGQQAGVALDLLNIPYSPVRHPANGGAPMFRQQIEQIAQTLT